MTLRAPIAGRVAHVAVETGSGVDTVAAPFVVEADRASQVVMQLPERLAQQVHPGMAVEIAAAGGGGAPAMRRGRIIAVAPSLDPATRSVLARADIGAAPGMLAGRHVMVTLIGSGRSIAVPERALTRIGETDHVFVRTAAGWEKRAVQVASRSGGLASIASGLAAGEVVAASSIAELKAMSAQ
jgi:cobalt-zinc-cadmium efflux system membrane fusion protein